uniref:AKTx n=1 Tax=Centruroides hentzi TaxID=88313 RepID=A0A2I9LNP9_9SCOR
MKVLYCILIIFIFCSMLDMSQEVIIRKSCSTSSICWSACKKAVGTNRGKCMNRTCNCYT